MILCTCGQSFKDVHVDYVWTVHVDTLCIHVDNILRKISLFVYKHPSMISRTQVHVYMDMYIQIS